MNLVGKASPDKEDLSRVATAGFDDVELYLERHHLDNYERTVKAVNDAPVDIVAVHTPHVSTEEEAYFEKASFLAERFEALLVMHSTSVFINDAIEIGNRLAYTNIAYEHDPGFSRKAIENLILGRGEELVLDAAHLYIASEHFEQDFEALLDVAAHLHLSDATAIRDGLPFGEGAMDVDQMFEMVEASPYADHTVLEVMPKHQEEALRRARDVLGDDDG